MVIEGNVINGRLIAEEIAQSLERAFEELRKDLGRAPVLLGIESGINPQSQAYIRAQQRLCQRLGIEYKHRQVRPYQEDLNSAVKMACRDETIDGIILHTPFPEGVDVYDALRFLSPDKDVEGMSPYHIYGMFFRQEDTIYPPTPRAVMRILDRCDVSLRGKECVVIGEGAVVGRPLALMLLQRGATVTVCHLATSERGLLAEHISRAEIVISAVGKARLIKGDWIRESAVVIDVGINVVGSKIVGDVEFETARARAGLITPVPGGVGPVTTVMLMENLYLLLKRRLEGR